MTWQRVEWNGLDLKIYRSYGTLADHFEIVTPLAGLTLLWRALSTAGATPVGAAALEAFRVAEGIPVYGDRHGRARPAAGDLADARSPLQQGLLSRTGDRGAHPLARQRPPPSAPARTRRTRQPKPEQNCFSRARRSERLRALRRLRSVAACAALRSAWCAARQKSKNQPLTYVAGATAGTAKILDKPPAL